MQVMYTKNIITCVQKIELKRVVAGVPRVALDLK